jgi:hypothetical protein
MVIFQMEVIGDGWGEEVEGVEEKRENNGITM